MAYQISSEVIVYAKADTPGVESVEVGRGTHSDIEQTFLPNTFARLKDSYNPPPVMTQIWITDWKTPAPDSRRLTLNPSFPMFSRFASEQDMQKVIAVLVRMLGGAVVIPRNEFHVIEDAQLVAEHDMTFDHFVITLQQ